MATASVVSEEKYCFEIQVSEVKRIIETHFRKLIKCLKERERKLLKDLEEMLNTFKKEREKYQSRISKLKEVLKLTRNILESENEDIEVSNINELISKQKVFTSEFSAKRIRVEFDGTVFGLAEELGRIVVSESTAGVSSLPVLAHKSGMTPVVRVGGKRSSEEGMFNFPYGVAVDYQTGNIYASDQNNNRIQVFDNNGEYLYKFGDKMDSPCSIAISENRVFVSQFYSNCVVVYGLNGTLVKQFGSRGSGESQFKYPRAIAISETNGDIYVCDCGNNRIQIFSKEFQFKSQFGQGILKTPYDIKLTHEFIYVLCYCEPFLCSFTHDFIQTHNTAISSISKHLKGPHSFCIDGSDHFIISDWSQDAIFIFNQQRELIHTITSVYFPCGITLDSKERLLVVDYYNHSLLIFGFLFS